MNLGRLALRDYHPFVPVVGAAYMARPMFEPAAVHSWRVLAAHTSRMFAQIASRLRIEFSPHDAYEGDYDALVRDIQRGRLSVWTGESQHAAWSPEENWQFRAVHDYMTHFSGDHTFTLRGEMSAYNRHVKTVPPAARPALFTEVVGQVCTYFYLGRKFGPQKVAFLYGFDYVNVGLVDQREYLRNFPRP
jgi:hypothetical protein